MRPIIFEKLTTYTGPKRKRGRPKKTHETPGVGTHPNGQAESVADAHEHASRQSNGAQNGQPSKSISFADLRQEKRPRTKIEDPEETEDQSNNERVRHSTSPSIYPASQESRTPIQLDGSQELDKRDQVAQPGRGSGDRKRVLRLNGKGGLGTPRKARRLTRDKNNVKQDLESIAETAGGSRSKLVVLRYGRHDEGGRLSLGAKINEIQHSAEKTRQQGVANQVPAQTQAVNPLKPTHPFFSTKSSGQGPSTEGTTTKQGETEQKAASDQTFKKTFTTPVKPKPQIAPTFDSKNPAMHLGHDHSVQQPKRRNLGAPLPWERMNHINSTPALPFDLRQSGHQLPRALKRKRPVSEEDELHGSDVLNSDETFRKRRRIHPSSQHLLAHAPSRSVQTGESLRANLLENLASFTPGKQPEHVIESASVPKHLALETLLGSIGKHSHAFERGVCEDRVWLSKYAPQKAGAVLQPSGEMNLLKNWLMSLKVDSVEKRFRDTPLPRSDSRSLSKDTHLTKRKRRKKGHDLDGFLVASDEEADEMRTLDDETEAGTQSRSLVRTGDATNDPKTPRKVLNAILVSGPPGCGKTAAAYAAAKEVGFNVFEINSAMRRSGKDILERVGDMSMNHQVKSSNVQQNAEASEENPLPQEAEAGQNTLNSFFSARPAKKKKESPKKTSDKTKHSSAVTKKQPRPQRQSLILLEEVDVLFEDDKQFWETVIELGKNSRRPIIMTCNDETTVPLDTLPVQAVLRFKPPPQDLAVPYLCMIAAAEGHLIRAEDAGYLYDSTGRDLRSSIMQLNFWCQMAVGSEKGGLDWYQRHRKRAQDALYKQHMHVVSDGTYASHLSRPKEAMSNDIKEDMAMRLWTQWGLDPSDQAEAILDQAWMLPRTAGNDNAVKLTTQLTSIDCALEALSLSDIFPKIDFPTCSSNVIDPSAPVNRPEACTDYTVSASVLIADEERDHSSLSTRLYTAISGDACDALSRTLGSVRDRDEHQIVGRGETPALGLAKRSNLLESRLRSTEIFAALEPLVEDPIDFLKPVASVAVDISPYVRSIVAYDLALEQHRAVLARIESGSATGDQSAKLRKTRASRSAVEGSQRENTRGDRYFTEGIDYAAVMSSGGADWPREEANIVHDNYEMDAVRRDDDGGTQFLSSQSSVE
ncbi:MAG: hypothetical protein Q9162_004163 [Coniocarpon cinnabarinum]